jgi:ribosomal protein S18 acetylase RimI-like enzyme
VSTPDAGSTPDAVRPPVTLAVTTDHLAVAGRLLHDFNTEYDDVTPGAEALAARLADLVAEGSTDVLLVDGGGGAAGVAVLRHRPSLWTAANECYLAELYVVPRLRGSGLGRVLLRACVDRAVARGCDFIDLSTTEDDEVARHLYESEGFHATEGVGGPVAFHYEREL